jgi:hypothetical protein
MKPLTRIFLLPILIFTFTVLAAGQSSGTLPDSTMTPGDTLRVSKADTCVPNYTKKVRNVPISLKKQVFANYNVDWDTRSNYEVDHLISLVLGGSNSIKNLWPQSYKGTWNARVKDALEVRLHKMVCKNQISLKTAQQGIATDWIAAYKKYIGPSPKALKTPKGWGIQ